MHSTILECQGEEVIKRLNEGDHAALAILFEMYNKYLIRIASDFTDNKSQAKDIVADTFIKVWERRNFKNLKTLRAFMKIVIINACKNYLFVSRRRTNTLEKISYISKISEDTIESKLINSQMLRLILKEAESLPRARKEIFKMIYLEHLSIFEIATKLNISVDTVRVQKARALKGLRNQLQKKGITYLN